MSSRAARWVAWSLCALSLVLTVLGLFLLLLIFFGTPCSWQARGEPRVTPYKGALKKWLALSVCNWRGLAALVLSLAPTHLSAWKGLSPKYAV